MRISDFSERGIHSAGLFTTARRCGINSALQSVPRVAAEKSEMRTSELPALPALPIRSAEFNPPFRRRETERGHDQAFFLLRNGIRSGAKTVEFGVVDRESFSRERLNECPKF